MLFSVFSRTSCLAVATALLSTSDAAILPPPLNEGHLMPQPRGQSTSNLTVDLGYGVYKGVYNASTGLNTWKGIRYAAPPIGRLRWQAPQTPAVNRTVVTADQFGPICPQANPAVPGIPFPGLKNEDCLFLNVYSPAPSSSSSSSSSDADASTDSASSAAGRPVYVYIHGGGYGGGDGTTDLTAFMNTNNNNFVGVTIQYRLGVFGFASSNDIKSRGVLNAGLLDQAFALQWIQDNIGKFGGDPSRVTIAGESAGGGSVMLHAIAQNGNLGTKWFKNIIAASPYLPGQANYNDPIPTQHYYDFAKFVGCPSSGAVFDCLVSKDTTTLQYANNNITVNPPTPFANWAFIPVTDGTYITGLPSKQLAQKKVNGLRMLVGNNAEEGALFVYGGINTQANLTTWIKQNFPNLSNTNVSQVIAAYPSTSAPVNPNDPKFATSGTHPPTAVNVSQAGTGQQQRAFNIYAEATFVCPSYWMASAFTQTGKSAWHYQWSVPFAFHASDLSVYFGPPGPNVGPDMVTAFRKIYGNFVVNNNPSISNAIANGAVPTTSSASNPASNWPLWTDTNPMQVNLNQTGGTPTATNVIGFDVVEYEEPGLRNAITAANAYTWEGGRGQRCDFWKQMSPYVPQ